MLLALKVSTPVVQEAPAQVEDWPFERLKVLLIACLFLLTTFSSLSPLVFGKLLRNARSHWVRENFTSIFSLLSCFGGGVFLATSLLDLLPDTRQELIRYFTSISKPYDEFPLAEFFTAVGFTLILCMEQVTVNAKMFSHSHSTPSQSEGEQTVAGTSEDKTLLSNSRPVLYGTAAKEDSPHDDEDDHVDPLTHSWLRAVTLVITLSTHALFEGLALGLMEQYSAMIQIFLALCIHKALVAFSLGLRLMSFKNLSQFIVVVFCLIFSFLGTFGAIVGMILAKSLKSDLTYIITGSLQGIACGTFLYIVTFEILPHELSTSTAHQVPLKLIFFILGVGTITLVLFYGHP